MTHDRDIFGQASSLTSRMALPSAARAASIRVARAGVRDLWEVARLQRRAFRPPLAYGFTTLLVLWFLPHVRFLIARDGRRIVGCAIGDWQDGQARVINLCVDPYDRRRGIGTRLLRDLEAELPEGNIVLMVEDANKVAQALYRREGYFSVGAGRDYYGRGHDGIWMQKKRTDRPPAKIRV